MAFELLQDNALYKKLVTVSAGEFIDGKWVEGNDTIVYPEFQGEYEPFTQSETGIILPAGVSSSDAIIVITYEDLKTNSDLKGTESVADIIYLEDPLLNIDALQYSIEEKEVWRKNNGFTLLDANYFYYLAVRKEKGTY